MRSGFSVIVSFFVLWLSLCPAQGAFLRNVPVRVVQPGGDTLRCFKTGDEYYNWLHDAQGYTIVRNTHTGWFEYALLRNGALVASGLIAGHADPAAAGIPKHLTAPPEVRESLRKTALARQPRRSTASTTGTLQNLVVFVRFSDQAEFTDPFSQYTELFSGMSPASTSLAKYYREASYNQLSIESSFFPPPAGDQIVSYMDNHAQSYYLPYDAMTNPDGYLDAGRPGREDSLLTRVVNAINGQIPDTLNIDANGDGFVDNITFIIAGGYSAWGTLLWPHRGWLTGGSLRGKSTGSYNFQIQDFLSLEGSSVLCHEMFHTLGATDLYHYSYDGFEPVGTWDLMAYNLMPPQHMGAYMKFRYGRWIPSIPEITSTGTYTLLPVTSPGGNCFMIRSPQSSSEYYVLEFRKREGLFETNLPGDGLLVYRINTSADSAGNGSGPPDEVYIYRPGGTPIVNGDYTTAFLSAESGRTQLSIDTDPSAFLSSGTWGGLEITGVGSAGASIAFTVTGPLPITLSSFAGETAADGTVTLHWSTVSEVNNYGFAVQRKFMSDSLFADVPGGFVPGHGTTTLAEAYRWSDDSHPPLPVSYRLREINLDGSSHLSNPLTVNGPTGAGPGRQSTGFVLEQNYPNPFNPATLIRFSVATAGMTSLTVRNPLGQTVATLFDAPAEPGTVYRATLDGTRLASGVYFYTLRSGTHSATRRLLLVR